MPVPQKSNPLAFQQAQPKCIFIQTTLYRKVIRQAKHNIHKPYNLSVFLSGSGMDPSDPLNGNPEIAKYLRLRSSVPSSYVEGALSRKNRNLFEEMEFAINCG